MMLRPLLWAALLVVCSIPSSLSAQEERQKSETKEFFWTSPRFSLCEQVGVFGTFSVKGSFDYYWTAPDGAENITSLVLRVSSPSFRNTASPDFAARLEVVKDGTTLRSVVLARPKAPAYELQKGVDELDPKYLPQDVVVKVPAGATLRFEVTPVLDNCTLGTSRWETTVMPLNAPRGIRIVP